jgi:hypothetical protein
MKSAADVEYTGILKNEIQTLGNLRRPLKAKMI